MKNTLGGKGANLAEMAKIGIPVPPGFTLITEVCHLYYQNNKSLPAELVQDIWKNISILETSIGKKFGDSNDPLLLSVRSGVFYIFI